MTNGAEDDENTASGHPTEPTEAAEPAAASPPPPPDEGVAPAGAPPSERSGWLVPKWVVAALVGFVVVAILFGSAFAIGRATAPGENSSANNERPFPGRAPREPGEGPNLPRVPRQANGVFLGVATEQSTDPQGVRVADVVSGSPAASAGLQVDDVITAVDGTSVASPMELASQIRSHKSGDQVTIAYSRGGNAAEAQVTLANRSSGNQPNS
jgi:S1-C subfamily serine protease